MKPHDVVIVGAGPAGSASALLLARAGFDVLLLDAREFPRAKACGDCISPGANGLLRNLGVWEELLSQQPARLRGWKLTSGRASFSAEFADDVSLGIARERLDAVLLAAAQSAGATVRTGVRVDGLRYDADCVTGVVAGSTDFAGRITIGADGLRSRVARSLRAYARGPRARKLSLTAHVRAPHDDSHIGEMHVYRDACLGVAPVESTPAPVCNVTVVLRSGTHAGAGPHAVMRTALRAMHRDDIAELIRDDTPLLASGPFDWPTRRIVFDGAALVGDAAGYFDPFTGQGVYQALAGAHLLAKVAAEALRKLSFGTTALVGYARSHREMMRGTRRVQHIVDYICARPRLSTAAFAALDRTPELAARLVAVTGDVRPARDLLSSRLITRFVATSLRHALPT